MPLLHTRIRQIGRAVGHVHRFRVIVGVFLKYGYDDLVGKLPLTGVLRWLPSRRFRKQQVAIAHMPRPERLRHAFEELGPAFVKLGQMLASRTQLLPREYLEELAKLCDQVPPVPFAEVQAVLAAELRGPPSGYFSRIDETPLGSASIAQVHRARLIDGTAVVVKVQRPNIEPTVRTDLEIMLRLAELLERHVEGWQAHQPAAIVAEFAHRVELELDFTVEVAGMERFAQQFEGDATVRVPRVFRPLCTRRLLTMEWIEGIPASHIAALEGAGLDRAEIARRLASLMLRQIFVHGYFHADPHPGNVHILPGNVVCFLDFGLTGFLVRAQRETLAALLAAIAAQDEGAATAALLKLAGAELEPPSPGLEADVADFTHRHFTGPVRELVFARLLRHFFQLTARHSLALPPEIFMVLKSLGQVEHLLRELAPDFDLMGEAKPFIGDLYAARLRPRRLRRELVTFVGDAMSTLRVLPVELRRIAAQLRGGKSKVTFKVEGLSPLNETLERVTNRLAVAVVLAAMIMASALIIHSGLAPTWHGISVIGLAGYVFAGMMGGALLLAIVRHGRM